MESAWIDLKIFVCFKVDVDVVGMHTKNDLH